MLDNNQIARVLGVPLSRVKTYWPNLEICLASLCGDHYTEKVRFAALATIRVECPPFEPIHEYGSDLLHEKLYEGRKDLGNSGKGDGVRYAGRGFIQITGKFNYEKYGKLLGVDLIDDPADPTDDQDPDKALTPHMAAAIFAAYFHDTGCCAAANRCEWGKVRKIVNGGTNGLQHFLFLVLNLAQEAKEDAIRNSAQKQLNAVAASQTAKIST